MASLNLVVLMGNLTRDVELKYSQNQLAIAKFGLAVNERVKKNNEWVDEPTFVDITLFGRTAEIANQYLSKGSSVLIEGRLKYDSWESDGQKRSKLHVIGEKMQMVGPRPGGVTRPTEQTGVQHSNQSEPVTHSVPSSAPSDEVPF
ncbi:MAG: single-stranded DNA-binding protein [Pirellulaceae bacterium]|jgi:single-strand DNA-binding protein|nr:single-stranded DNA-binding protein [Pirellulaceae bacterium]